MRIGRWAAVAALAAAALAWPAEQKFTFAILGDRTGEAQPGVYEQIWRETAAERPAFILATGDSIQGLKDDEAEAQWKAAKAIWSAHRAIPLYLAPGNHDIWSAVSEKLFEKYSGRALHYSFDYEQTHVTVLDNSRSDALREPELQFLAADLKAHAAAPVKFIVMHRPSWLLNVALGNGDFELHRLARQYGVKHVIAGHVHQLLRFELDGITYLSMPSSGAHLRLTQAYDQGWFFGHAKVNVSGAAVEMTIEEAKPPHGEGRVTKPADWGAAGLLRR